jgi:hypothetical protein
VSKTRSVSGRRAAQQVPEKFQQVPDLLRRVPDLLRRTAVSALHALSFDIFHYSTAFQGGKKPNFFPEKRRKIGGRSANKRKNDDDFA